MGDKEQALAHKNRLNNLHHPCVCVPVHALKMQEGYVGYASAHELLQCVFVQMCAYIGVFVRAFVCVRV